MSIIVAGRDATTVVISIVSISTATLTASRMLLPWHCTTVVRLLTINERNSRDTVCVVAVMLVLISPFDQFLLCLFETKWSHKALSISRNIDICHVTRVIDSGFSLQWPKLLRLLAMGGWMLNSLSWRIILTFVYIWLLTVTLDRWHLTLIRINRILARWFLLFHSWWYDERITWLILSQGTFFRLIYLLQLWHWCSLRLVYIDLLVCYWNFTHERIRIPGCTLAWNSRIICFLVLNSARLLVILGSNRWIASRLGLCHLNEIFFFKIVIFVLVDRLWISFWHYWRILHLKLHAIRRWRFRRSGLWQSFLSLLICTLAFDL